VAAEVGLALGVFVVTGLLTSLQPAREAIIVQGIRTEARDGDVRASLRIQPGAAGANRFELMLTDRQGAPLQNVERVALRFTMLAVDLGDSELSTRQQPDGSFVAQGGALVAPGPWRIEAVVRRPGLVDARPIFTTTIGPALPPGTLAFAVPAEEGHALAGIELAILALGVIVAVVIRWRPAARWLVPPAVGTAVVGLVIAGSSMAALAATVRNPIPPTQASLARGREIYVERCAVCHGDSGRGDGPAAAGLTPRPADFRVHLAAGHTDAQLFDWVSNGYPGSAMPAFRSELSEEDRWNVLNHIRVNFGPGVPSR
jgi:mono/diheme cytochrome c family protein